jgi:ABC exporter DevB family membrane fusion protein
MFRLFLFLVLAGGAAAAGWSFRNEWPLLRDLAAAPPARAAAPASTVTPRSVVAPGRVEPVSEEIDVAAELGGRLKRVIVRTGDSVAAGQLLAELDNDALKARVALAMAQVQQREAALRRVVNGARPEERAEGFARVKQAEAIVRNAKAELERRNALAGRGFASTEEAQRLERVFEVARADLEAAEQQYALLSNPPREEDLAMAHAELALAEAQLSEATARLQSSFVRAPIAGTVLRVHRKAGEAVSDVRETPILTMGDTSTLRIRAEVDETDVAKVRVGQRAYVQADAFGTQRFYGKVVEVGPGLGSKRIRSDVAGERLDVKILETLIELEKQDRLLPGLRVDVFLVPEDSTPAS